VVPKQETPSAPSPESTIQKKDGPRARPAEEPFSSEIASQPNQPNQQEDSSTSSLDIVPFRQHDRHTQVFRLPPEQLLVPVQTPPFLQEPLSSDDPFLEGDDFVSGDQEPPPVAGQQDYVRLLENFHARISNDKILLARQLAKGGITQEQFNRNTRALDDLLNREYLNAEDNNGDLAGDRILQLSREMDMIHAQILADMAA
jgi:hypothetical protein